LFASSDLSEDQLTPLEKIVERKGPYLKVWFGQCVTVLEAINRRDVSHVKETRAAVFKVGDDGEFRALKIIDGKPKWRRTEYEDLKFYL